MDESESDSDFLKKADAQIQLESAQTRLQEQNSALQKANTQLRAQFEDAVRISSQLEGLHQKNREFAVITRDLKAENDKLRESLEISRRTNLELNEKLEDEKRRAFTQQQLDHDTGQRELQNAKQLAKSQIDDVYGQLQHLRQAKDTSDTHQKQLANKINRLIQNAEIYFDGQFSTPDDLIAFLGTPEAPARPVTISQPVPDNSDKRVRILKSKLKVTLNEKQELETALLKFQREKQDNENHFKRIIAQEAAKRRREEEDRALADSERNHAITLLQAKIDTLKSELEHEKKLKVPQAPAQIRIPETSKPDSLQKPQKKLKSKKNSDIELVAEGLTERNTEIANQLQSAVSKLNETLENLRAVEERNGELELMHEKVKTDLAALELVHEETKSELTTVRAALHQKDSKADKSAKAKLERELQNQRVEISSLRKTIESQEAHLHQLGVANESGKRTIEEQNVKQSQLKNELRQAEKTIDAQRAEICRLEVEVKAKPTVTEEGLLPQSAWKCAEFGSELNAAIAKVGSSTSLQPASKIQSAYHLINKYFQQEIQKRDRALDQLDSENQTIYSAVNEFVVSLSISLGLEPITAADFFNGKTADILLQGANELKDLSAESQRKAAQLKAVVDFFHELLGLRSDGQPASAFQTINEIKTRLDTQSETIRQRSRKCRDLRALVKGLQKASADDTAKFESQIAALSHQSEILNQDLENSRAANQTLKAELHTAKTEFRDYQQQQERASLARRTEHANELSYAEAARSDIEAQLNLQIRRYEENCAEISNALAEANDTIHSLKKVIHAQKDTLSEKEAELANLRSESADRERLLVSRADNEKTHLINVYEKAVSEIREQCDAHRSDVERLSAELAASEKRLRDAKEQILDLKRKKLQLEQEFKEQSESADRNQKLVEAAAKTAIVTRESELNTRLHEQKSRWETERRRLLSFVVDAFKQYFNVQDVLDERAMMTVVRRAKDALASFSAMNAAIRKIVGAAGNQRTEDAVSQVMLSRY